MSQILQGLPPSRVHLAGIELTSSADAWDIKRQELRTLTRSQTGRIFEIQLAQAPDLPLRTTYTEVGLTWKHIFFAGEDQLRRIRVRPGPKTLVLWRREDLAYVGNGDRREFRLPNSWTVAIDTHSPTGGVLPTVFAPVLRIDGVAVPFSAAAAAEYDAGDPPAGEGWWRQASATFKVAEPPSSTALVDLTVVPVYRVYIQPGEAEKVASETPRVEPYELLLLEDMS